MDAVIERGYVFVSKSPKAVTKDIMLRSRAPKVCLADELSRLTWFQVREDTPSRRLWSFANQKDDESCSPYKTLMLVFDIRA